jgi:hypothetical protein
LPNAHKHNKSWMTSCQIFVPPSSLSYISHVEKVSSTDHDLFHVHFLLLIQKPKAISSWKTKILVTIQLSFMALCPLLGGSQRNLVYHVFLAACLLRGFVPAIRGM